jgi:negative regulator of replication initiation
MSGNSGHGLQSFPLRKVAVVRRIKQGMLMKKVELSDEAYAALQRMAEAKNLSPAELIAALIDPNRPALAGDSLLFHLASAEFACLEHPVDRYLALLAWCAKNYTTDFADFVSHQESGRRYLAWNRAEINEARARNQARQIDGTPFWAVMTIDDTVKRRFVCRLLEFIGCHDETVALACRTLGFATTPPSVFRRLSA